MGLLPFDCCCANLQVASLVAVLKVARQLNLVRDLDRVTVPGHDPVHIPEALLRRAIEHGNDTLLVDAMALVCSHPKSTAVPGMQQFHYLYWTQDSFKTVVSYAWSRIPVTLSDPVSCQKFALGLLGVSFTPMNLDRQH